MNQPHVYEIVIFKAKEEFSTEQILAAAKSIQPTLTSYKGYISRELIEADGQWVDIVTWGSFEAAHAAAEDIMSQPGVDKMMSMIETDSINMMHGTTVFSTQKTP